MAVRMNETIQPGDAILFDTKGAYGRLIQFGEAIRWKKNSRWHHAAIVVSIDADGYPWCFQMARRGEITRIDKIAPGRPYKVIPCPNDVDAKRAVDYANTLVGTKYGVLTIVSIAFNILTPQPIRIDLRRDGTLICSAAVIRAWEHGGFNCHTDPFQISPAQIDSYYGHAGWEVPNG